MKNLFKQLFCRHDYHLNRWHWTHGPTAMDLREIEAEYICSKCGKVQYRYVPRGSELEWYFIETLWPRYDFGVKE